MFGILESGGLAITSDMLTPIVTSVTQNVGVILPVGISLMGIMIGVKLIPKMIGRFTR